MAQHRPGQITANGIQYSQLLLLLLLFLPPGKTQSVPRSVFPFPYALPWACEVRSTTGDPSVSVSQFKADISRVKGERSIRYVHSGCCLSPFSHKVFTSISHCKPRSILLRHNSHLLLLLLLTGSISYSSNDRFISFILVGKTTH